MVRFLVGGAILSRAWTGGEPLAAHTIVDGLRRRGHSVAEAYRPLRLSSLLPLAAIPLDWDPVSVRYYRREIERTTPDVVLGFYDFDTSLGRAARECGVPYVLCAQIHWPACPVGVLYIDGKGICPGPSLSRCLHHLGTAIPNTHISRGLTVLPAPLGLQVYMKFLSRKRSLASTRAIIAPSRSMAAILRTAGYEDVHVVPSGIDLSTVPPPQARSEDGREVLLPSASTSERKGLGHFRETAGELGRSYRDVRFVATNYTGDGVVAGTPLLSRSAALQRMADAYAVVVPIVWDEPFGFVFVEAMAARKPVVTFAAGAAPEIVINEETGLVVPRGNTRALLEAMRRILDDEPLARRMGQAGRLRAEHAFTADRMVEGYLEVAEGVLRR